MENKTRADDPIKIDDGAEDLVEDYLPDKTEEDETQDPRPFKTPRIKILLDTNFFLVPFQLGLHILPELERIVPEEFTLMTISPIKEELNRLSEKGKGDDKICATLALEFAKSVPVVKTEGAGDDAIVDFAKRDPDIIVATNDSDLRKRLKSQKTKTIFVRNRSKIEME